MKRTQVTEATDELQDDKRNKSKGEQESAQTIYTGEGINNIWQQTLTLASFGLRKASYTAAGPNPVRDFTEALWVRVLRHCMNTENARDLSWSM